MGQTYSNVNNKLCVFSDDPIRQYTAEEIEQNLAKATSTLDTATKSFNDWTRLNNKRIENGVKTILEIATTPVVP